MKAIKNIEEMNENQPFNNIYGEYNSIQKTKKNHRKNMKYIFFCILFFFFLFDAFYLSKLKKRKYR